MVRYIKHGESLSERTDIMGTVYSPSKESISQLFQRFGTDCAKQLNGDFALVISDAAQNMLYGAVDRMGEKTLYYYQGNEGFAYGTSLLQLVREIRNNKSNEELSIDEYARQCYFTMQYIPSPNTIIKQIKKLNPGEWFTYSLDTEQLHIEQYWDIYDNTCGYTAPKSYDEALDMMHGLIVQAVKDRIKTSDYQQIGTFLSGGIDSSLVTMVASKLVPNLQCYSISFGEEAWDESYYAQEVAKKLGVKFNKFVCTPDDAIHVLDGLQHYYDEPMGDASMIPTSFLCEKASKHIQVALGGDGGDEIFFGYPRYLRYANRTWLYTIPYALRQPTAVLLSAIGKKRLATSLRMHDVQELYMNRRQSNLAERFDATQVQQSLDQCRYLYTDHDIRRCFNDFDIKTLMCHAYNVKLDRAALRANIETRVPLVDYRIVEYSRQLPIEYCYTSELGQKRILRDLLYRELPRELFERKKRGFGVPVGEWMRGPLKDYLQDMLNAETVKLLPDFDANQLLRLRDRHIAGIEDQTTLLWLCINYIAWYKLFEKI